MSTSLQSLEAAFYILNVPVQCRQSQSVISVVGHCTATLEGHLSRRHRRQPCHAARRFRTPDAHRRIESCDLCIARKQSEPCDAWHFVAPALVLTALDCPFLAKMTEIRYRLEACSPGRMHSMPQASTAVIRLDATRRSYLPRKLNRKVIGLVYE